jgi:hypothetical protein
MVDKSDLVGQGLRYQDTSARRFLVVFIKFMFQDVNHMARRFGACQSLTILCLQARLWVLQFSKLRELMQLAVLLQTSLFRGIGDAPLRPPANFADESGLFRLDSWL